MPTQVTYALPGHQGPGEGMPPGWSMMLTVHSQVTFSAPTARNRRDDMPPGGDERGRG